MVGFHCSLANFDGIFDHLDPPCWRSDLRILTLQVPYKTTTKLQFKKRDKFTTGKLKGRGRGGGERAKKNLL